MPFLYFLILGFASTVITFWFRHHFLMLPANELSIGLPLLVVGVFVTAILFFCFRYYKKHPSLELPWRPIFTLPILLFFSALIFNTQAFLRGFLFVREPLIPFSAWASANLSFLTKLGSVVLTYTLITVAFWSAGSMLLRLVFRHSDKEGQLSLYDLVFRIVVGMLAWSTLLLIFGMLGGLSAPIIWMAFFFLLISERRSLLLHFRPVFHSTEYWRPDWKKATPYLLAIGLFLVSFALTQSIRPEPTGYDDMTYYMNRVHLMSQREMLVSGNTPYPFELIAATLQIASRDETMLFAMSFGTYCLFFGALILYGFGQALFNRKIGLLAATLLLSVPMGAALAIREVKPDSLLFPVSAFILWSLFRSIQEKKLRFWYNALLLFSFAATIKLTALFLIAPIAITAFILFLQRRSIPKFRWRAIFWSIGFGIIPFLPWIGYGATTHPITFHTRLQELITSHVKEEDAKFRNEVSQISLQNSCNGTGSAEDSSRFLSTRSPLENGFFLPWDLTMNTHVGFFATEIGFFFLALLPFSLAIRRTPTEIIWYERPAALLTLFASAYFLLWIELGKNIFWYSYPGLALLILLVAYLSEAIRFSRILFFFFWTALWIGLLGNTLVQMKLVGERAQILFLGGLLPADRFLDESITGYGGVADILNRDRESRVLVTSSQLWYGITDNERRAIIDPYLDIFSCLSHEGDDALTLARLRDLNIRYVVYARGYNAELISGKRPTLTTKIEAFASFIGRNLKVVSGSPYYTIFEVPQPMIILKR